MIPDWVVRVQQALAELTILCSWEIYFILSAALHLDVYMDTSEFNAGANPAME